MPDSETIFTSLTAVANGWQLVAVGWHVFFAVLISGLVVGWARSLVVAMACRVRRSPLMPTALFVIGVGYLIGFWRLTHRLEPLA